MNASFISVVVASVNGPPSIIQCLDTLTSQKDGIAYEVLLVGRCGEVTCIDRRFARLRLPKDEDAHRH
jgi:hypothetical protein